MRLLAAISTVMLLLLVGCVAQNNYKHAFSESTALQANTDHYAVPAEKTFQAIKSTFVRQGFNIDQADFHGGIIKATRNFKDSQNEEISFSITATADIETTDEGSLVTLAASQQTILHRKVYEWWHLLWLIPLFPIGVDYQTVVTAEGNITEPKFYTDFFADVHKTLAKMTSAVPAGNIGQKNIISSTTGSASSQENQNNLLSTPTGSAGLQENH